MALTLSQAFQDAFDKANPEPVFIVNITTAAGTSTAIFGKSSTMTYPESVLSITPIKRDLDILTNALRIGSITIEFAKDNFFDVLWASRLRNQQVEVLLGEASMSEGDFEPYFEGVVASVKSRENKYIMNVASPAKFADDVGITGTFLAQHPLEIAEAALDRCNLESAMKVTADWDPTDAAYASTISHWNCSLGGDVLVSTPSASSGPFANDGMGTRRIESSSIKATKLLNECGILLGGRITEDEAGRIRFVQYDDTTAAVDSWTNDDIRDFTIVDLHRWLINRVEVAFADFGEIQGRHIVDDDTSQSNFAYPGGNDFVQEHKIDTQLLNAYAMLDAGGIGSTDASFDISGALVWSFCGMRWPSYALGGTPAQPASAAISSTRKLYLKIDSEIIECTALNPSTSDAVNIQYYDPDTGTTTTTLVPNRATVTVTGPADAGRGARGTTAAAHVQVAAGTGIVPVFDVTIPIAVADAVLERHSNGVPVIEVTTNLSKYNVQVGDFVTISSDRYRAFNKTTLGTSVKWEVIGKEVLVGVGNTEIKWTLAKATDSADPATSISTKVRRPFISRSPHLTLASLILAESVGVNHIASGMAVTSTAGFVGSIAAGLASNLNGRTSNEEARSITFSASKDTYVYWDNVVGQAGLIETALGAGTPTLRAGCVWLAKVVTDGSGITSITDPGKVTTAINGSIITASTVDSTQLAASAVTTAKISPTAVTTAKIAVGAVTSTEIGVSAVITSKIAASAVTTSRILNSAVNNAKIYDQAVTASKLGPAAVTASKIGVSCFAAFRSGSNQSVTNKTITKVEFNSEDYDNGSDYDNATNFRWTAPENCYCNFTAQVTLDNLSTATYAYLALRIDGATVKLSPRQYNLTGSTLSNFRLDGNFGDIYIASGSYAEVWVYHDETSSSRNVTYNSISDTTWFTGRQIRG